MNENTKIVDPTHPLSETIPSWDGNPGFNISIDTDYEDCTPPDLFRTQKIKSNAGMGTHIDAPAHVIPGGRTVDQLSLDELITDCVVIHTSSEPNENYTITPSVIEKFEEEHGAIPPGSFVIFHTGWSKRWNTKEQYHNNHLFPSLEILAAELLLSKNIAGIGIDTLSCDTGKNGFLVHRAILGADKYLVENVANGNLLPPTGARVYILPMNIQNATEAPVRLVALI